MIYKSLCQRFYIPEMYRTVMIFFRWGLSGKKMATNYYLAKLTLRGGLVTSRDRGFGKIRAT